MVRPDCISYPSSSLHPHLFFAKHVHILWFVLRHRPVSEQDLNKYPQYVGEETDLLKGQDSPRVTEGTTEGTGFKLRSLPFLRQVGVRQKRHEEGKARESVR